MKTMANNGPSIKFVTNNLMIIAKGQPGGLWEIRWPLQQTGLWRHGDLLLLGLGCKPARRRKEKCIANVFERICAMNPTCVFFAADQEQIKKRQWAEIVARLGSDFTELVWRAGLENLQKWRWAQIVDFLQGWWSGRFAVGRRPADPRWEVPDLRHPRRKGLGLPGAEDRVERLPGLQEHRGVGVQPEGGREGLQQRGRQRPGGGRESGPLADPGLTAAENPCRRCAYVITVAGV